MDNEWVIQNDEEAERAYLKIKSHEAESESYINNCKAQIEYYQSRIRQEEQRLGCVRSFYAAKFKEYFDSLGIKKKRLPSGSIGYKSQQPEYIWNDDRALEFLEENKLHDYLRIKKEPAKDKLKKEIEIINGKPVLPDGQILEGLQIEERSPIFIIK